VNLDGTLIFSGRTSALGKELWVSDGEAAGTSVLVDIREGPSSSFPDELTVVGGNLFFVADDGDGSDGLAEIITGAGPGGVSLVRVFDGTTGTELNSFSPYGPVFSAGVLVGAGNENGAGNADLVTGLGAGVGPELKVFGGSPPSERNSFAAFDPSFTGGVFVAGSTSSQVTIVNLPATGGTLEVFADGADLVVQQESGAELFRESQAENPRVRINGTADVDDLLIATLEGVTSSIIFDAGAGGNDALRLEGNEQLPFLHYEFFNSSDGTIFDAPAQPLPGRITFYGLEPIIDNLSATDRVFDFPRRPTTFRSTVATNLTTTSSASIATTAKSSSSSSRPVR
jgi:ELWxxDGT repeat protein